MKSEHHCSSGLSRETGRRARYRGWSRSYGV